MKISKPLMLALVATVVVAAFLALTDDSSKAVAAKKSAPIAKKSSKDSVFDKADYTAQFQHTDGSPRNVFLPIAGRLSGALGLGAMPDAIPAQFAGNESDWIYTGTAEVDGVPVALFESTGNREGVFLKQGESWKSSRVLQIGPDYVVLASDSGLTHRISLPPYNLGIEEGPMDVSGAARAVLTPRVTVTPAAPGPLNSNDPPENPND